MRLRIVRKDELTVEQSQYLDERLGAPEHKHDGGPPTVWHIYQRFLYAFVLIERGLPIGISEASGRPVVVPGWWIDSKYRGQGYGRELVDLLAPYVRADGATSVGAISIQTYQCAYDAQSVRLVQRFHSQFAKAHG
jgi:RimJ/RimL family protein N-acetyltransferase